VSQNAENFLTYRIRHPDANSARAYQLDSKSTVFAEDPRT
jgi:hypothetical protein